MFMVNTIKDLFSHHIEDTVELCDEYITENTVC